MCSEAMEYYPYKSNTGVIIFTLIVMAFALLLLCITVLTGHYNASMIMLFTIGVLAISSKNMYYCGKVKICLDSKGVSIHEKGSFAFADWDNIKYSYLTKDYKGHQYLLLSSIPMSNKEMKHAANKSAVKSQVYFGEWCSVYLSPYQPIIINKMMQHITCIMHPQQTDKGC